MANNRTWHKGPPPHVGWWNASFSRQPWSWRWWDGVTWSSVATFDESGAEAAKVAAKKEDVAFTSFKAIEWCDFYPTNARVPRTDPAGGGKC